MKILKTVFSILITSVNFVRKRNTNSRASFPCSFYKVLRDDICNRHSSLNIAQGFQSEQDIDRHLWNIERAQKSSLEQL